MRSAMVLIFGLTLGLLAAGCRKTEAPHNFSHLQMRGDPLIEIAADPACASEQIETFYVLPPATGTDATRHALLGWLVADTLESYGYHQVTAAEEADVVVGMALASQYHSVYVAPSTRWIPWPVPARYSTSTGNWVGAVGGTPTWGHATSQSRVPGYWTAIPRTTPGRVEGYYLSGVSLAVYRTADAMSGIVEPVAIWKGSSVVGSTNPNPGITAQVPAQFLALRFIGRAGPPEALKASPGWSGLGLVSMTPDGSAVWPTVTGTYPGSPAERAGLRVFDIIAAIDGESTANRKLCELRPFFGGRPGEKRRMTIWRLKDKFDVELTLVARPGSAVGNESDLEAVREGVAAYYSLPLPLGP